MQLKKLALIILFLALVVAAVTFVIIDYLPVKAAPLATVLPQKTEEKPQFLFVLGNGSKGKLKQPISVAADDSGRIYVTDAGDGDIKVYQPDGTYYKSFGKKGSGHTGFGYPYGIGVLKNGDLVVCDSINLNVRIFSKDGQYKRTLISPRQRIKPGALAVSGDGRIFVSDLMNQQILEITSAGKIVRKIKPAVSPLKYPQELAEDSTGNLWVADSGNFAVKKINQTGQVVASISGWGEPAQPFSLVRGMSIDSLNRLMIADTINGTVDVMSLQGKELFSIDGQDSPVGKFVYPSFVFVDRTGKIYITDRGTAMVQVWGYTNSTGQDR